MEKGPILNNNSRSFTTRDSLGIESVAASISRELCPIVNTVTPRAFYWPFMVWIYYDFYKYSGIEEHTVEVFDKSYLKRQDYFFVLSQLLVNAEDQYNLVGKQNTEDDVLKNKTGMYTYNPNYFVSRYGGMQYYNAGCITLDYIREYDVDNNRYYSFPKITKAGEHMALAFQEKIKDTEYYKKYRLNDVPVPKDVLIEYGKVINLSMKGFDDCKSDLIKHLFEIKTPNNLRLNDSARYIKHIFEKYEMTDATLASYRAILFDEFSTRGKNEDAPDDLKYVINGWEIVVGRQYFTSGLECIWKYMLEQIYFPHTKREWMDTCIKNSEWSFDIKKKLSDVIGRFNYDFETREDMIYNASHYKKPETMVENGLKIVLSMYNRFVDRSDFDSDAAQFLYWGNDSASISFEELIERVEEYKNRPVEDFLKFIMDQWLMEQHYLTAFEKMVQGRDGFYYDIVDGHYSYKHSFDIAFQGIRLFQLAHVMKDLDLL